MISEIQIKKLWKSTEPRQFLVDYILNYPNLMNFKSTWINNNCGVNLK